MPLPTEGPTALDDVKGWSGVNDDRNDTQITLVVNAVNAFVRRLPVAQRFNTDPAPEDWSGDIKLGATMLAARVFRRKNTPGGVEAAGAFGVAYVRRNDPDVAQMLELGEYASPAVG